MDGKVVTDCGIRVLRKGKVVHVGVLDSLRRVKEIVKEVMSTKYSLDESQVLPNLSYNFLMLLFRILDVLFLSQLL